MKVLFDTNIVLDLLLARHRFVVAATNLFTKVEHHEISGYLCATTITTVHYLIAKKFDVKRATSSITHLLGLFEIAPVSCLVIETALKTSFRDFEDALLHEAARYAGVDAIVTRNAADFSQAQLAVYDPTTLLAILKTKRGKR